MQRPDPMIAAKPGAEDVQAMAARTLWLEEYISLMAVTKCRTLNMVCSQVWLLSTKA